MYSLLFFICFVFIYLFLSLCEYLCEQVCRIILNDQFDIASKCQFIPATKHINIKKRKIYPFFNSFAVIFPPVFGLNSPPLPVEP